MNYESNSNNKRLEIYSKMIHKTCFVFQKILYRQIYFYECELEPNCLTLYWAL